MKRFWFVLMFILLGCVVNSQTSFDSALVAYYPLDGNTLDLSKYSQNGIDFNMNYSNGHNNLAGEFNGTNSYIYCHSDNRGIDDESSISAWVKTTASGKYIIVGKYNWKEDKGFVLQLSNGYAVVAGRNQAGIYRSSGNSQTYVCDGEWHHIVGVAGLFSWEIWVDGVLENSGNGRNDNISLVYMANSEPLTIGKTNMLVGESGHESYRYFEGLIDEVMIFKKALNSSEIGELSALTIKENQVLSRNDVKVYPNPTDSEVIIETRLEKFLVEIFDMNGRLIEKRNSASFIDVSLYDSGVYFFQIRTFSGDLVKSEKIIVK